MKVCEQRFERLPNVGPIAIYACDHIGRIIFFNTGAEALWGQAPIDDSVLWCGSHQIIMLDGTPVPKSDSRMAEALRLKRPVFGEDFYVERPDGSRSRIQAQTEPVFDGQGQMIGAVCVLLEINAAMESERTLKLRSRMLDQIGEAVICIDPNGIINYWNNAATETYGLDNREAMSRNLNDVISVQMSWQQTDELNATLQRGRSWTGEFQVKHKLGRVFTARSTYAPVLEDSGALASVIVVSLDVDAIRQASILIQQIEDRYQTLFNSMSEGVALGEMIYDDEGRAYNYRCLDLNPAAEKHLGYSKHILIGRTIRDFIQEPNVEALRHFEQVLRTGKPTRFEFYSQHLAKLFSVVAFRIDETRFGGIMQDVTEARQTHEALRKSESRFRGLFTAISGGVVVHDASGAITNANAAAAEILGLSQDQLLGLTSLDARWHVIHEDGSPWPGDTHPAATTLRTGEPVQGAVMGVFNLDENDYRWIVVNTQPVFSGGGYLPETVVVNFVDITKLKQTEEALLRSREQFETFMENVPGFAWIKDLDGRYVYLNKQALASLPSGADWKGKKAAQLWSPDLAARFDAADSAVITAGSLTEIIEPETNELNRGYLVSRFTILDKSKAPTVICGIALDATEVQRTMDKLRKEHGNLARANERLEAEISQISEEEMRRLGQDLHDDICQNLAAVSLISGDLASRLAEEGQEEEAGLASRIESMLGSTLLDSRNLARGLHALTVDTHGLHAALTELAARASGKVPCRFESTDPQPARKGKVALGLYRIAQEAVSNALKHSEARQLLIRLDCTDSRLELSIIDDGRGAAAERTEGMGLHIMSHRASVLGGTLELKSPLSGGTTVTCVVPSFPSS